MTQDADGSAPMRGSQPVAWAVFDGPDRMHLAPGYSEAESCAEDIGGEIVPLYRSPTLTDAEREAVEWAAITAGGWYEHAHAATLRGLLERTK